MKLVHIFRTPGLRTWVCPAKTSNACKFLSPVMDRQICSKSATLGERLPLSV